MICWRCHSNSVNTGSRLSICLDVKTRKRRNVVEIDMIRNNRIGTKLCLNSPLMTPFQNCVRQSRHPTNMATVAKNRKGGWNFNVFPLKLLGQLDSNFAKIILWWSPFKILSGSPVLGPRCTSLLFINDSLHIKYDARFYMSYQIL